MVEKRPYSDEYKQTTTDLSSGLYINETPYSQVKACQQNVVLSYEEGAVAGLHTQPGRQQAGVKYRKMDDKCI
jgi:hypothetical protein